MPAFPDLSDPLLGDGVAIRFAAERDIPEVLIAHEDDPTLYRALRMDRPPSGAELGRRTELLQEARRAGTGLWLTVLARAGDDVDDECRGQVEVIDVGWENQTALVQLWIAAAHRGHGLGTAALALVARWLLTDGGIERVDLMIDPDNAAMRATAAGAGFREEGTLRRYLLTDRGRVDVISSALIASDLD